MVTRLKSRTYQIPVTQIDYHCASGPIIRWTLLRAGATTTGALVNRLGEDYGNGIPSADRYSRVWYSHNVYSADNDVCYDQ